MCQMKISRILLLKLSFSLVVDKTVCTIDILLCVQVKVCICHELFVLFVYLLPYLSCPM